MYSDAANNDDNISVCLPSQTHKDENSAYSLTVPEELGRVKRKRETQHINYIVAVV